MNVQREKCAHPEGLDYCAATFDDGVDLYWVCKLCGKTFDDLPKGAKARGSTSASRKPDE